MRRPNNYDHNVAMLLGPTEPNPTMALEGLDMIRTVVADSPDKLFIGGLPCDWSEEQVACPLVLVVVSCTSALHSRLLIEGLPGHWSEQVSKPSSCWHTCLRRAPQQQVLCLFVGGCLGQAGGCWPTLHVCDSCQ